MNPFIALVLTFVIALAWLRLMDFAAHRGWIESRLSRKIIHIGTGPIFVLCWLMFPDVWYARWLAALVPLLITAQFALVGLGVMKDEASVKAMSRTGDRREILRGPLFYGIVFVVMTLVYWKDAPHRHGRPDADVRRRRPGRHPGARTQIPETTLEQG
jgi:phytol kinase